MTTYMEPDVDISFTYHPKANLFGNVRTNIKSEYVDEILGAWLYTRRGVERDSRSPNKPEDGKYHIRIGIDLSDDSVGSEDNMGNRDFATEIVLDFASFLSNLSDIEREAFLS